jgi:hypothetical protein
MGDARIGALHCANRVPADSDAHEQSRTTGAYPRSFVDLGLFFLPDNIQIPERCLGSSVGDCERRDEGGELRADADRVPRLAQVTDRAPVTGQPRDLLSQVSSGRATAEHPLYHAHDYEVALVSSADLPVEGLFLPRRLPLGPDE